MRERIYRRALLGLLVAVAAWAASPATAETIVAQFTGGNDDTTVVDAWHGIAGDGWAGPWGQYTKGGPLTASVVNTNPLDGGGNYLQVSQTGDATTGRGVVGRIYGQETYPFTDEGVDNPLGIDLATEHTVSWKFRVDETNFDTDFSAAYDNYSLYDMPRRYRVVDTSGAYVTWMIHAWGAVQDGAPAAKEWLVYNGDGANTTWDDAHQVRTYVPLAAGVVYDMTVTNHARDTLTSWGRYDVTIDATIGGTPYHYDSKTLHPEGLGFRSADTTAYIKTYGMGGGPQFMTRVSDTTDVRQFSVDAVSVIAVPEPSMLVMGLVLALAAMGMAGRRGR